MSTLKNIGLALLMLVIAFAVVALDDSMAVRQLPSVSPHDTEELMRIQQERNESRK